MGRRGKILSLRYAQTLVVLEKKTLTLPVTRFMSNVSQYSTFYFILFFFYSYLPLSLSHIQVLHFDLFFFIIINQTKLASTSCSLFLFFFFCMMIAEILREGKKECICIYMLPTLFLFLLRFLLA